MRPREDGKKGAAERAKATLISWKEICTRKSFQKPSVTSPPRVASSAPTTASEVDGSGGGGRPAAMAAATSAWWATPWLAPSAAISMRRKSE